MQRRKIVENNVCNILHITTRKTHYIIFITANAKFIYNVARNSHVADRGVINKTSFYEIFIEKSITESQY